MTSIITGDLVNSRKIADSSIWLDPLKELLSTFGKPYYKDGDCEMATRK
ncbi:MAG: hypothetical protein K9I82_13560 [Chitinophagaceae bacterium]|nr:hypothetical protein [Chitinophagaceae bacterium]